MPRRMQAKMLMRFEREVIYRDLVSDRARCDVNGFASQDGTHMPDQALPNWYIFQSLFRDFP